MMNTLVAASIFAFATAIQIEEDGSSNDAERHVFIEEFETFLHDNFDINGDKYISDDELAVFADQMEWIQELP